MDILITNNPLVFERFCDSYRVEFLEVPLCQILIRTRDLVHEGHRLLTHPLSGSVKPNETPYKSILVSGDKGKVDEQSLRIIEESIHKAQSFAPSHIAEKHLADLQLVDFSLISNALER